MYAVFGVARLDSQQSALLIHHHFLVRLPVLQNRHWLACVSLFPGRL